MRTAVVGRTTVSYMERAQRGVPVKPPLLLLHGLVAAAESFSEMVDALPDDRRIVALDLLSAEPAEGEAFDVGFAALAEFIQEFAGTVGLEQPVVLGHSHGGALALRLAASWPDEIGGLVLLCPAHPFGGYDGRVVRFYLSAPGRMFARMLRWIPRPLHWLGQLRLVGPRRRRTLQQVDPYQRTFRLPNTIPRVLRLLESWEADMSALRGSLQQMPLQIPVLLLWGNHDRVVPLATAAQLREHLPEAELVQLQDVGHLPSEEAPEECAAAIQDWLNRVEQRRASLAG